MTEREVTVIPLSKEYIEAGVHDSNLFLNVTLKVPKNKQIKRRGRYIPNSFFFGLSRDESKKLCEGLARELDWSISK